MMLRCGNCGTTGQHVTSECPYTRSEMAAPRPPWCGTCDKRTRLIDHGDHLARCAACHPLAWKPLVQHKRCAGCNKTIFEWDSQPCGSHQGENPGPNKAYTEHGIGYWRDFFAAGKPEPERDDGLGGTPEQRKARAQAAESRRQRA